MAPDKALEYAARYRLYAMGALDDGRLPLDNNLAERGIKPFVAGRKNFLFGNMPRDTEALAGMYSIVVTAKTNGLNPRKYTRYPQHLGDVLAGHARSRERHGLRLQRRVIMAPGPAGFPFVRRVALIQSLVQRLARGISQPAYRARHRPAALLDRFDGPALLLFRVARHPRTPNRTDSV